MVQVTCASCKRTLDAPDPAGSGSFTCEHCSSDVANSSTGTNINDQPPFVGRSDDEPTLLTAADVNAVLEGGRRQSRFRELVLWVVVVGATVGCVLSLVYVVTRKQAPQLVADLEKLGEEAEVAGYIVRPPRNYPKLDVKAKRPPGLKTFFWGGTRRPDGTAPVFHVMIGNIPSNERIASLEASMIEGLEPYKRRHPGNWSSTQPTEVLINNRTFLFLRWSGINSQNARQTHGIVYFTMDGRTAIFIHSQDVEPHHDEALKVAESAAASFRKIM